MATRRRLPHLYPEGCWLFLTWHLYGSLPQGRYPPSDRTSAGKAFVWMDRYLDGARSGPLFLRQRAIATLVVEALFTGAKLGHYGLGPFAVMANHVHVLLLPKVHPSRLLKSLKGYTAREANRLLGRTGEPFWQSESFDHMVRDSAEFERIAVYIENNPLTAGVVEQVEEYEWSSANPIWRERIERQASP